MDRHELIEALSAAMHDSWVEGCRANGLTTRISSITGEEQMVPYDQLSDAVKKFDQDGARAFLATVDALGLDIVPKAI